MMTTAAAYFVVSRILYTRHFVAHCCGVCECVGVSVCVCVRKGVCVCVCVVCVCVVCGRGYVRFI